MYNIDHMQFILFIPPFIASFLSCNIPHSHVCINLTFLLWYAIIIAILSQLPTGLAYSQHLIELLNWWLETKNTLQ